MDSNKKIAIMQPYVFPFLGYYQLVNSADYFISYNDVNFIERGWINRNYLLSPTGKQLFTVPLIQASSNKLINEILVSEINKWKTLFLKTLYFTYKKAPYFEPIYSLVETVLDIENPYIDTLANKSITNVFSYLEVPKQIELSSQLDYERNGDKITKIISITSLFNAETIHFPSGSKNLYTASDFKENKFTTFAIIPVIKEYIQFKKNIFESGLSIIDVLMFNSKETIIDYFNTYKIEPLDD